MPELPEVETIVRKLQGVLPGKSITGIARLHPKSFQGESSVLEGRQILSVTRRAKIIQFHFDQPALHLLIHLKMTGQLIYVDQERRVGGGHPTADWVRELPSTHTRVQFTFDDDSKLFFNDQRLFGWLKPMTDQEVSLAFTSLGPDVIDPAFSAEYLQHKVAKRQVPIKVLLLDPTIVAGLGNIYVCDALNLAKISPYRLGKTITQDEAKRLVVACQEVVIKGIELGGTTFDGKYVTTEGLAGHYQSVVRVYSREGQPCPNCGSAIVKTRLAGRGTYWCQHCQV